MKVRHPFKAQHKAHHGWLPNSRMVIWTVCHLHFTSPEISQLGIPVWLYPCTRYVGGLSQPRAWNSTRPGALRQVRREIDKALVNWMSARYLGGRP